MIKISVIIPVYNAEKYLARCLKSVINQTFKDIEIICINDVSSDNSAEILNAYAKIDERIRVINNPQNMGAALSRNAGIDAAKGEYIYFIDADDYIDEKYLAGMFSVIEREKCDIVFNAAVLSESSGNSTPYKHPSMPEVDFGGRYFDNITTIHDLPCFIWARIYRKSFLDKHNLRLINVHCDDVVFNTVTNLYCDKTFAYYGEKYHYTVINNGMTGNVETLNRKDLEHMTAYSTIYDYLNEHNIKDDRLKLFRVYPFFKVDTDEKFDYYKMFFEKIKDDYNRNEELYNELEKYFAQSILSSQNYAQYLKIYNKIVTMGFLRRGVKK